VLIVRTTPYVQTDLKNITKIIFKESRPWTTLFFQNYGFQLKKAVFLAVAVGSKKNQAIPESIPYSPFILGRNIYFVWTVSTI